MAEQPIREVQPISPQPACIYPPNFAVMSITNSFLHDFYGESSSSKKLTQEQEPTPPMAANPWATPLRTSNPSCFLRSSPLSCNGEYHPDPLKSFSEQHSEAAARERERATVQREAAVRRRKRESERMQELGQLVPGAGNTSKLETLHAVHNYVKFMQAQVAILDYVKKVDDDLMTSALMGSLLGKAAVQEKLASEGLCLVPARFVEELSEDRALLSRPAISRKLRRFLR